MILKLEKCSKISTFLLSQCSKFYMKEHKTIKLPEQKNLLLAPTDWPRMISLVIDIGIIYFYHVLLSAHY